MKQGQVLARLETGAVNSQARQAEHAVKRADAEVAQATEQHERARRLLPAGAVSRQDFESQRTAMLSAQAVLRQAQAAWEEQRLRQAHSEIRAPVAGLISQRSVQVGSMVGTQTTLFRLINDTQLEFQAQIPQQALPDLSIGMPVWISTSGRNGVLKGTIRLIGTWVDPATGYGYARIALDGTQTAPARPGSVGSARIELEQRNVMALDIRALRFSIGAEDNTESYVFVVDNGRARRTPVQLGLRESGWVEIRGGLETYRHVVVTGATFLQDGDEVLPREDVNLSLSHWRGA
ncbi:transporter [Cupriavidus basilensis OR16]|uniref:Transporter n=1 Tax=Cupriavidus basilensis OR16 TaxID=1127483 RepID=H1SA32_9BURK|nr:transporter [Cupriavidus basilensis OR16]